MNAPARPLSVIDRRMAMRLLLGGAATAALAATPALAEEFTPPFMAQNDVPTETQPPVFNERMARLPYSPVSPATNIQDQRRTPAIVVMDEQGSIIYGRYDFSGGPYSVPARGITRTESNPEVIAAQYQFTASITKVITLLAAIEWIKEEAAKGPHESDAIPSDPLLHPGLEPYAGVLGRTLSLTPRINTGGIMFHRDIDPRGTIDSLEINQVILLSQLYSTNDLLSYFRRHINASGGRTLDQRISDICQRLNMQDSTFPTVHGMGGTVEGRRVDCRSTAAEMLHAMRVLDNMHPEFAVYVQQIAYRPANHQLAALRNGELRPRTQYIEGPLRGPRVTLAAASAPADPYIDSSARDLNAAFDPLTETTTDGSAATATNDEDAPGPDDGADDDVGPVRGYEGVRMMKTGQLGTDKNRRGRMLRANRRTSWRTSLGMATRVIDGVEHKIYFWTSSDSAGQRQNAIREALREGFGRLEINSRLARANPPQTPQAPDAHLIL